MELLFIYPKSKTRNPSTRTEVLSEAAFAGLLFSMPTILFGTPFIEFRTTQLLGVLFALPYLVYGLKKRRQTEPKLSPFALKPHSKPAPSAKFAMTNKFAKNSIFNFMGAATPALANLVAVPVLVNNLGKADYGLLTLVLALVGYFSLLDISATQGSTRFIAEYDSLGQPKQANEVISFGLIIYLAIGVLGMALIYGTAPLLIKSIFEIPAASSVTALATLKLAAVAFLFSQLQAYLVSIPQAMQRYGISAAAEAFFGSSAPLLSMGVVILDGGIEDVVAARLGLSVINVGVLLVIVLRLRPDFKLAKAGKSIRQRLLSFSAFSYLSNIAAVSYAHADRMILGILLSLSDITLYSMPTTLVNRLFGMTYRLGSVIYPAASELAAARDRQRCAPCLSAGIAIYDCDQQPVDINACCLWTRLAGFMGWPPICRAGIPRSGANSAGDVGRLHDQPALADQQRHRPPPDYRFICSWAGPARYCRAYYWHRQRRHYWYGCSAFIGINPGHYDIYALRAWTLCSRQPV